MNSCHVLEKSLVKPNKATLENRSTIVQPLVTRQHLERVDGFVQRAKEAGARLKAWWKSFTVTRSFIL